MPIPILKLSPSTPRPIPSTPIPMPILIQIRINHTTSRSTPSTPRTSHPHPPQDLADDYYRQLTEAGVPALFGLQDAAAALRKFVDYYQYQVA